MKMYTSIGTVTTIHEWNNTLGAEYDGVNIIFVENEEDVRILRIIRKRTQWNGHHLDEILERADFCGSKSCIGFWKRGVGGSGDSFRYVMPMLEGLGA